MHDVAMKRKGALVVAALLAISGAPLITSQIAANTGNSENASGVVGRDGNDRIFGDFGNIDGGFGLDDIAYSGFDGNDYEIFS